jgi:hypothetical protein
VLWVFCFQKCRYYFKIRDAFNLFKCIFPNANVNVFMI